MSVTGQSVALEAVTAIVPKRILRAGTAAESAEYATDASRPLLGVSRYRAAEGQGVTLQLDSIFALEAGAAIAIGDWVTGGEDGKGVPALFGAANVLGVALSAASADGQTVSVLDVRQSLGSVIQLTAGANIVAGRVVHFNASDEVTHASGSGTPILGVALHDAANGDPVLVQTEGIATVTANANVAVGDAVTGAGTGVNGGRVDDTTANNAHIVGFAISAGTAGNPMQILVRPGQWGS